MMNPEKPEYHSDVAFYHDQKNGGFDPETGAIYPVSSDKYYQWEVAKEKERKAREFVGQERLEDTVKKTIDIINAAVLEDKFANDSKQQEELKKMKSLCLGMIRDLLRQAKGYWDSIGAQDSVKTKKERMDQDRFVDELINSDKARKLAHNALLDQVRLTVRNIRRIFGVVSDVELEEWIAEREKRNKPVVMVKRIRFPKNVLLPESIDISNRKQVANWSHLILDELAEIEHYLEDHKAV